MTSFSNIISIDLCNHFNSYHGHMNKNINKVLNAYPLKSCNNFFTRKKIARLSQNNSRTLDNLLVLRCKLNQIFFKHKKECVGCEKLFDIVIRPDLVGQS